MLPLLGIGAVVGITAMFAVYHALHARYLSRKRTPHVNVHTSRMLEQQEGLDAALEGTVVVQVEELRSSCTVNLQTGARASEVAVVLSTQQVQAFGWENMRMSRLDVLTMELQVQLQPAVEPLLQSAWVPSARRRGAYASWHSESGSAFLVHRLHSHNLHDFKSFVAQVQTLCEVKLSHPNLLPLRGVGTDLSGAASQSITSTVALLSELPEATLAAVLSAFGVPHKPAPTGIGASETRVNELQAEQASTKEAGPLDWGLLLLLASDVAKGLAHLHALGTAHGQLSMRNVVLNKGWVAMLAEYIGNTDHGGTWLSPPTKFYAPDIGSQYTQAEYQASKGQEQQQEREALVQKRAPIHTRHSETPPRSEALRSHIRQALSSRLHRDSRPAGQLEPSSTELPESTAGGSTGRAQSAQLEARCQADVFAFGRLLCGLAMGREVELSFVGMLQVVQGQSSPTDDLEQTDAPPAIQSLAKRCCARWPRLRPSMDEVVKELAEAVMECRRPGEPLQGWRHTLEAAHRDAAIPGEQQANQSPPPVIRQALESVPEETLPLAGPTALLYRRASVSAPPNELMAEQPSSSRPVMMSQGKLTDVAGEVPIDQKARKEELLEGDALYADARGTEDAPGRSHRLRGRPEEKPRVRFARPSCDAACQEV